MFQAAIVKGRNRNSYEYINCTLESNVGIVNFVDMINFLININLTVIKEKQYKYYTLIKIWLNN
jgi:hypothetical protein